MGYFKGVVHGMIIGGAVALLYAPKPGRQMREELSDRFGQVRGQMQPVIEQAQGLADTARPQVERGISRVQQQAQRVTRRGGSAGNGGTTAYGGSTGMGSGTTPSPGA